METLRYSILTVDCLRDWHWIIRDVLKKQEVELTFADSISEAKHYLADGDYDLVISGYKMPDGIGMDIFRLVEKMNIPFIFCTSYPREMLPEIQYKKFGYVWKGEVRSLASEVDRLLGETL